MSRLEEIKKQYAAECNYNSWKDLVKAEGTDHDFDQVSIRYAKEVAKASLEKASEESRMNHHNGFHKADKLIRYYQIGADNIQVDKQSITNPENIVLL